jgi:hypothetical protein
MLECLIIGDSIGVGLSMVKPECVQIAVSGINSYNWYKDFGKRPAYDMVQYRYVIISIGTNDHAGIETEQNIMNIRSKITADKVIWLMPNPQKRKNQFEIIMKYVRELGDIPIDVYPHTGKDDIHPATMDAYKKLSGEINWRLKR